MKRLIMRRLMSVLLPVPFAYGIGVPLYAQGIEWETLNNEVMALYRQGRYDRAVVVAKNALQVAEQAVGPDHPDVATSLENMAALYRKTGRKGEAEAFEKRAAAIRAIRR